MKRVDKVIRLKHYQEKAVNKVTNYIKSEHQTVLLVAPTGAGKTIIGGALLEELSLWDRQLAFIWISIGKSGLHQQSQDKIRKFFPNIQSYSIDQIIQQNVKWLEPSSVLFMNWEAVSSKSTKTGEWTNIFMQDSEYMSLARLMENTKAEGTSVCLIVDEAHSRGTSARSKEIIDIIDPAKIIYITATPRAELIKDNANTLVEINSSDVIQEGVIKQAIAVNKGIRAKKEDNLTQVLMDMAVKRREQLVRLYKEEKAKVNPLCLIQIPNGEEGDVIAEEVEKYLQKKNITQENGKLAVWLSKDKINVEAIEAPNGYQEYLIFKQAIDTGWDCPRSQILVKFREVKSEVFSKQVLGRILRMPELKHYKAKDLNQAYVYTNEDTFKVDKPKEIPSHISIPTETIEIKPEYEHLVQDVILTTFPFIKPTAFCDNKAIMLGFSRYMKDKIPFFIEKYSKHEGSITTKVPRDILFSLERDMVEGFGTREVQYSDTQLRYIIYASIKSCIGDKRDSNAILDYIFNRKPDNLGLRYYLEAIVFNLSYIIDKLTDLLNYYTTVPTIKTDELAIQYTAIPSTLYVNAPSHVQFDKLIYQAYPNKTYTRKEKQIILELEADNDVKWWFYNKTFSSPINLPANIGGINTIYKPRFVCFKNDKITLVDYTEEEENYKELLKLFALWAHKSLLPVYGYDLRYLVKKDESIN